nr:hypothetical protein [Tanacetum cinerariifolium]
MGHFSRECRAQGGQNSNNYQKYKSKEAGKDGSDSKAMVVVDGSIDWDKQTKVGNTRPRSLENFGMIAGIKVESDVDSEGEVVSTNNAIPTDVSVPAGTVAAVVVSPQFETEFALMGLSTKGQPIYNRFASVDHMKVVPPSLTGNYMPPSNIPDIDESQMVYGKKSIDSSEIKTNDDSITHSNDSVLFDFSDRSSEPSTNDLQTCDSSVECSRPNHNDHDSTDSLSSVSTPASESRDTIVIDCNRKEDFTCVCTSSIQADVKSSKTLCNKFGSFNKESHFRKHKSVASKSCYVCGSYLHLKKDCDIHEQRFAKRNAEGKGILKSRPTGKPPNPVSAGRPNPVSADQPNPVSAGQPNTVSAGDGILGKLLLSPQQVGLGQNMVKKAKDRGIVDSGCSRSMSGNKDKLEDFKDFDGGEVTFEGSTGKISRKGTIKTKNLNFENFQIACSSKIQQSQAEGIQRCSWCFKFHIQDPNVAVDTPCCSTLNPHTALMTIYYWKLDNKQVTIQFRGGLLGIVIPAARVLCSCWQVFISAGVLFLLVVLYCCR